MALSSEREAYVELARELDAEKRKSAALTCERDFLLGKMVTASGARVDLGNREARRAYFAQAAQHQCNWRRMPPQQLSLEEQGE